MLVILHMFAFRPAIFEFFVGAVCVRMSRPSPVRLRQAVRARPQPSERIYLFEADSKQSKAQKLREPSSFLLVWFGRPGEGGGTRPPSRPPADTCIALALPISLYLG